MLKRLAATMIAGFLTGCVGQPVLTQLPADHPANPNASAAAYTPPPNVLKADETGRASPAARSSQSQDDMRGMDMDHMDHMNMNHDMKMDHTNMDHDMKMDHMDMDAPSPSERSRP